MRRNNEHASDPVEDEFPTPRIPEICDDSPLSDKVEEYLPAIVIELRKLLPVILEDGFWGNGILQINVQDGRIQDVLRVATGRSRVKFG